MKHCAYYIEDPSLESLKGKVFTSVETDKQNYIRFYLSKDAWFYLCHEQEASESVFIESIEGDLQDLIDSPILMAEEVVQPNLPALRKADDYDNYPSWTWTFSKFATVKGHVTIRWYGASDGNYSEEVDLFYIKSKEEK